MKVFAIAALLAGSNAPPHTSLPQPTLIGLSCSPRKTCSKSVESCEYAYWYMENCSWGRKLDGDHDGVPCENMCSGG